MINELKKGTVGTGTAASVGKGRAVDRAGWGRGGAETAFVAHQKLHARKCLQVLAGVAGGSVAAGEGGRGAEVWRTEGAKRWKKKQSQTQNLTLSLLPFTHSHCSAIRNGAI